MNQLIMTALNVQDVTQPNSSPKSRVAGKWKRIESMAEKIDLVLNNSNRIAGMKCPFCGNIVENENLHLDRCPHCLNFVKFDDPNLIPVKALRSCPDCRKNISRIAEFCVHCGRPMQPNFSKKIYTLLLWLVGLSIAASIGLGIWFGYMLSESEGEKAARRYGKEIQELRKKYGLQ